MLDVSQSDGWFQSEKTIRTPEYFFQIGDEKWPAEMEETTDAAVCRHYDWLNSGGEQIESQLSKQSIRRRVKQQESRQAEFIKGPLPLPWMIAATALPGMYPLAVALVIRFRAGLEKTGTKLRLTTKMLKRFGINRQVGYRALAALEGAGLTKSRSGPRPVSTANLSPASD
jgi:hypothetical protein